MKNDNFAEAAAAHAKVKETADALRAEHTAVCEQIDITRRELDALPLAPVPLEDLKAAILELVDASGKRFADYAIVAAITSFATGNMGGMEGVARLGKPLCFGDIERAIGGANGANGSAQFASYSLGGFDDQALYFFFGDMVKAGLRRIMDEMTPEQFGYGRIHPDKIGTGLVERRRDIKEKTATLAGLIAKRDDLAGKLVALGYGAALAQPMGRGARQ